jgi:hypothetical protein
MIPSDHKIRTYRSVFGNGNDLDRWLSLRLAWTPDGHGADFHDLVWQEREGENWKIELIISNVQFRSSSLLKRWVSDLHSFNPLEATAIVKVGEANTPALSTTFNYSWRSLHLRTMGLQLLQQCKFSAEPYAKSG